jgi:predicted ArsR family transcriptional regulator
MQNRGLSKTESDNSRIMKVFTQSEQLTISEIAARTTVNYVSARAHLQALERSDILARIMFGKRIRYYEYEARGLKEGGIMG